MKKEINYCGVEKIKKIMEETNKTLTPVQEKPKSDASEALLFSVLLTIIGGFFETYSYVARDHVFANGQTGNMARLGMNLATGDFAGAFKYLIPIVCFALGVYLAEMVKTFCERHHILHWKSIYQSKFVSSLAVDREP